MSSVLEPICRGLVGYVSYLAACRNSTIYSEYLLYEPLLRIAQAQGYTVACEVAVSSSVSGRGDKKRLDFVFKRGSEFFGVEVKWIRAKNPNIVKDVKKLIAFNSETGASGYVIFFGQSGYFSNLTPTAEKSCLKTGKLVYWNPGRTKYSARWFKYA